MAIEDVQKFLQALDDDEDLAVRADNAFVTGLQSVAHQAGYQFSEDDLRQVLDGGDSLSDSELDDVAGGLTQNTVMGSMTDLTASGGTFDTVFGGTSSMLTQPTLTRFSSFSKYGFRR